MWYLCWMSLISSLGQLLAGCKTAVFESLTSQRFMFWVRSSRVVDEQPRVDEIKPRVDEI